MMKQYFLVGFLLAALHTSPAEAEASDYRRIAVVVGANAAPPGRKPLRFAHMDADNVAAVLTRVGGLAEDDIHVLHDPKPEEVLAALDEILEGLNESQEESLLFFYYSGHADAQSLYPSGLPLGLADLRARLDNTGATVRLGLIDACRGGGWTGAKGLSETDTFKVNLPLNLANEGSVLISSSSGLEDAHESESLRGSFFTHHWNAALRGAGDEDQDSIVTLVEAFEYAKSFTIRDTALHTNAPQHPSFQLNLRGQRDLELVNLTLGSSHLNVEQQSGPLQLIHLGTGLIVLEIPKGKRKLKLSVPAGRYMVRRRIGKTTSARELQVQKGAVTEISEEQLELIGTDGLVAKGASSREATLRPVTLSMVPDGKSDIRLALGVRHGQATSPGFALDNGESSGLSVQFGATRGLTDRLDWSIGTLGFAYSFGRQGKREWIPWGGLTSWGIGYSSVEKLILMGTLTAGLDSRVWLNSRTSLNFGASVSSNFRYRGNTIGCSQPNEGPVVPDCETDENWNMPTTLRGRASIGYSHTFRDTVTLNIAISASSNLLHKGKFPSQDTNASSFGIGSVQNRGLRNLPLIQLHLSDALTADALVSVSYNSDDDEVVDTYMLGATWLL